MGHHQNEEVYANRRNIMIHDVVRAVYKGDYNIELEFNDGKRGVVDFSEGST